MMSRSIAREKQFVDTSAFIALADASDQYHAGAVAYFEELLVSKQPLVTSNFILDETYTWLKRKLGFDAAITFGEQTKKSAQLKVITVDEETERRAWKIFVKYRDQAFSYTDCTSFALMQTGKLNTAFAFDGHFVILGFHIKPDL